MRIRTLHPTQFLTEYAAQAETEDIFVIPAPAELADLSYSDLTELQEQALSHFDAVYADGSVNFTEDDLTTLQDLTNGIEALQAEISKRESEAAELAAKAQELAAKVKGDVPVEEPAEDTVDPAETADETTDASVTAAARVNLSRIRRAHPKPVEEAPKKKTMSDYVFAMGDANVVPAGTGVDWNQAADILQHRLSGFNRSTFASAARTGAHMSRSFGVISLKKPIEDDMVINGSQSAMEQDAILRRAMDESRLQGGSLLASGGWCAPSETLYDLCELESSDGLFDLPEIGIARGGISRTLGPDFAQLFNEIGFHFTEEQDVAGEYGGPDGNKPCYYVPCPDFEDIRLDVDGICVSAGLLQSRAYPEMLARVLRGAVIAHQHKMAGRVLSKVAAGSEAITFSDLSAGATAPTLSAIELQAEHMRYTNRMARNATIEAVFPYWVRGAIRSDLALRLGVDLIDVSDARIDGWFRTRGIAPQFVYNWQDINTETAGGFINWPNTLDFVMYPAGTWVRGSSELITLENVQDSKLTEKNDFTALFSEEGYLVAKMCHDSRKITVPICANGMANAGGDIACSTVSLTDELNKVTTTVRATTTTTTGA